MARTGSMVTSVPPRIASVAGGAGSGAAVRGAGIRRKQKRYVVVRVCRTDVEVDADLLQERGGPTLPGQVPGDVEDEAIRPALDRSVGQVGDAPLGVGGALGQGSLGAIQRYPHPGGGRAAFHVQDVGGQRGQTVTSWPYPGETCA